MAEGHRGPGRRCAAKHGQGHGTRGQGRDSVAAGGTLRRVRPPGVGVAQSCTCPCPIPATDGPAPAEGVPRCSPHSSSWSRASSWRCSAASCWQVSHHAEVVASGGVGLSDGRDRAAGHHPAAGVTPSPMTTEELLSGMVTEEVEPGVYRVVNDGVRDLTSAKNWDVVAGRDGGIWVVRRDRFFRLGSDAVAGVGHQEGRGRRTSRSPRTAPSGSKPKGSSSPSMARGGRPTTRQQAGRPSRSRPMARSGRSGRTRSRRTRQVFGYLDEDGWQALDHLDRTSTACMSPAPTTSGPPPLAGTWLA